MTRKVGRGLDTFVKVVLVLLALLAAASSRVELVTNTAEKASARLLVAGRLLLGRALGLLLLVAAAGELVDEIHG